MGKEIERKFWLPAFPSAELERKELAFVSRQYIYQTYLAYSGDQEIRVRQLVDPDGVSSYTHTFKSGHGIAREEIEYGISADVYRQLLEHTKLIPLEKVRTTVQDREYSYEIDEYKQFELTVVEVEFPDLAAAERFQAPAWFGRELGQEDEFRNKTLWMKLQKQRTE